MRMKKSKIVHIVLATGLIMLGFASFSYALEFSFLDQAAVIDAAKSVTNEKYPNAEVVHVDQRSWTRYNIDGTYVQWYESYVKILSEKGRRRYKSVTSSFTIPYNTTMFTVVEVIRSDGSVVAVDIEKNSREMVEQSQMDSNIYNPNDRLLRVTIPEINIGDMVHFIMFDEFSKARMPGTFSDYVTFEGTDPIKRSEYRVVAPRKKPLQSIALKAEISGTITSSKQIMDGEIVYTWVAQDVPRAFEEPQMPKLYTQVQRLLVSTIPDWETVSRWYWNLSEPHIEKTTPEMKKLQQKLLQGIDDPQKKIETIFQWVSQEVRYLGITAEKDAPGYEPHPVDMTFERRSGVCRDKAALLVAMLRMAGFDAFPVLIMNGPKKDVEVPQPFFNHAISGVRKKDGTYELMDATDESTKELFPAYLGDQSFVVATPEGETLLTSPVSPPEKNMMHIETTALLDEQGNLKASSVLSFEGINDNAYRGYFSRLSPDERRQYFERVIKRIVPSGLLTAYDITPSNMLDTSRNLQAQISFEVKDFLVQGKDTIMLPVPHIGESIGIANFMTRKMGLKKRKYPYVTDVTCGIKESFIIELAQSVGAPVSMPEFMNVESPGATWKRHISVKDSVLTSENVFTMNLPEYSPEEYHDLKQTLKKIEADSKKKPIFSPGAISGSLFRQQWYEVYKPDAVILDEVDEFDVENESTWTETKRVKMKVLTYAGKKKYSDLHIRYNPAWEEVKIKSAVVTSPGGEETVIEDKEMNLMDAEWVADAPRYPASRILVVSLPGVEEGSIIDYTISRKKTGRSFFSINGEFFLADMKRAERDRDFSNNSLTVDGVFRFFEPVEQKTLRLKVPKGMRLNISPLSSADESVGCLSDYQISEDTFRLNGNDVYEFTATRVPPVMEEDYLPPWYSFNPIIFASSGDWKSYAGKTRKVLLEAVSSQKKTAAKARGLVSDVSDAENKIKSIRDYVAKNIKKIDIDFGEIPTSYISSADRTLLDGYGNSADRAVVLFTMLGEVGFHPEFVLASRVSQEAGAQSPMYQYPFSQWFSDVLVRVLVEGRYIYLNDTDQYAALGSTENDRRQGLVLASGKFDVIRSARDDLADRTELTISITLEPNGDITMKKTRKLYGQEFSSFSKEFREMPPEERSRHHEQLVSAQSQAAVAKGEYITDYDSYPGIEEFSLTAANYATRQDKYLYLSLPGLFRELAGVNGSDRKNPLYRPGYDNSDITIEVVLPSGVRSVQVLPPQNLTVPIKRAGEISLATQLEYDEENSTLKSLIVREQIDLAPAIIMPGQYPQLLEAQRILSHPASQMITVEME
jgi:hypothetical protein